MNLDPAVAADLKYLVNVDYESSDAVCVSSAGGVEIDITCDGENGMAPEGDLPLTEEVYREQNGSEINVDTVHATLECGTFAVMNPSLDMVSIGPDLVDVHSTSEMLYLRTIPKTFNLLAGILDGIAAA